MLCILTRSVTGVCCSVGSTNEMLLHSLVLIAICSLYNYGRKAVTWFKSWWFNGWCLYDSWSSSYVHMCESLQWCQMFVKTHCNKVIKAQLLLCSFISAVLQFDVDQSEAALIWLIFACHGPVKHWTTGGQSLTSACI